MKRGGKNAEANKKKGDEFVAQAKKAASTGLLKWKADWEQAAHFYREAVKIYAISNSPEAHLQACLDSVGPHEKINDINTCAKNLEEAAKIYEKELKEPDPRKAHDCYKKASSLFRANEQYTKAAAMLLAGATIMGTAGEATDSMKKAAYASIKESVVIFKEESKAHFANEHFKKSVSLCIEMDMLDEAVELLKETNKIYAEMLDKFENDIYKGIVSIVVILFHKEEYLEAENEFKEGEQLHNFMMSDEWQAASALFEAYRTGSAEDLETAVKKGTFQYLPSRIARMARKLKFSAEVQKSGGTLKGPQALDDFLDDDKEDDDDGEPDFS